MRTLQLLKESLSNKDKEEVLIKIFSEEPLLWRMIVSYFNENIYVTEEELINYFRYNGIHKKCEESVCKFICNISKEFKDENYADENEINIHQEYLNLVYQFKRTVSLKVRYKIYFNLFLNCKEEENLLWICYFLLGQLELETGITKNMISKIEQEVIKIEQTKDIVINVLVMNKETNEQINMDFVIKKELLNSVMRDKVFKEFDKNFKDTCDKLSTYKNMNKLI